MVTGKGGYGKVWGEWTPVTKTIGRGHNGSRWLMVMEDSHNCGGGLLQIIGARRQLFDCEQVKDVLRGAVRTPWIKGGGSDLSTRNSAVMNDVTLYICCCEDGARCG